MSAAHRRGPAGAWRIATLLPLLFTTGCVEMWKTARTTASTRTGCAEDQFAVAFGKPIRYCSYPANRDIVFKGCGAYMLVRCDGKDAQGQYQCRLLEWVEEDDDKLSEPYVERIVRVSR